VKLRLIAIASAVKAFLVGLSWRVKNLWILVQFRFRRFWQARAIRKIACEFCAEVAVLVAVFPTLEFILGSNGRQDGAKMGVGGIALSLSGVARASIIITVGALLFAFILSTREGS
jgi:hypothetical protein